MKKIKLLAASAAALALLASCQEQEVENLTNQEELVPVSLTASFNTVETKVSYTETTTDGIKLQPAWNVGDKVIGFDEATPTKHTYTFTVSKVDGSGVATLDGTCPSSCTLHLIYLCDSLTTSIKNGTLAVSYDNQAGVGAGDSNNVYTMPAVMLSDGEVAFGSGDFRFSNAGAVIGVKAVKGMPSGSTISRITVSGEDLSAATIALDGSRLKLTAKTKTYDAISTATLSGVTVADDDGTLSKPVLIAVPAGATVSEVSVNGYAYTLNTHATLAANEYSYIIGQKFKVTPYVKIAAKYDGTNVTTLKWARQNLSILESGSKSWKGKNTSAVKVPGTDEDVKVGDYFQWATYEGYCVDASVDDKGLLVYESFINTKCVGDTGTDSFQFKSGKTFYFPTVPYYSSSYSKYTSGSVNLEESDDVANIILGGDWRMPTSAEFKAMREATYWAWDSTDQGYYVFTPGHGTSGAANGRGTLSTTTDDKTEALLFFPAAGYGSGGSFLNVGSYGNYWSCSLGSSNASFAYRLNFDSSSVSPQSDGNRCNGRSVRPVSD